MKGTYYFEHNPSGSTIIRDHTGLRYRKVFLNQLLFSDARWEFYYAGEWHVMNNQKVQDEIEEAIAKEAGIRKIYEAMKWPYNDPLSQAHDQVKRFTGGCINEH